MFLVCPIFCQHLVSLPTKLPKRNRVIVCVIYFYFMNIGVLPSHVSVHHMHTVPAEGRKPSALLPLGCKWLLATVSEGIEPESFGKGRQYFYLRSLHRNQVWCTIAVNQALGRLWCRNDNFQSSLGYKARLCLGNLKNKKVWRWEFLCQFWVPVAASVVQVLCACSFPIPRASPESCPVWRMS